MACMHLRDQVKSLVHTAEGGHIHSLSAHDASTADAGRVLTGASADDSVNQHLDRVLVGEDVNDLKSVADNAHCHELLSAVAAVVHKAHTETLRQRALCLQS